MSDKVTEEQEDELFNEFAEKANKSLSGKSDTFELVEEDEAEEEEKQEEPEQEDEPEEEPQDDEPEDLPEVAEKQPEEDVSYWKHKYNSDIGRINAYQRQIQELQEKVNSQAPSKPENVDISDKEWSNLKEDYPEIAQAIEAKFKHTETSYEQRINQLTQQIEPLRQQQQEQYLELQRQTLTNAHPDWRDIVSTAEYNSWLNNQPTEIQGYMNRQDADSNIYLLNLYKAMTGQQRPITQNSELQQKRQKQLQQSKTVSNRAQAQTRDNLNDADEDALFDFYAKQANSRLNR
jgi:hypothetical protein